ncbi:RecQ family ATP-dependent DNA helicase [Fructilactobacillus vespulae]|uniref:RecQ family ATP-dependent DNA helicase n=1 Tax=Fructilactobacillus vespulae TaxID=1249630 RepID=UPI0039B457C1
MMVNAQDLLKSKFGFNSFKLGQAEAIKSLHENQNTMAILPTGAGKSLIYQLYGYQTQKPVIIISPLLSLMEDQVDRIHYQGEKRVVALNSNYDRQHKQKILNNLNHFRYIFISPEMILQPEVISKLVNIDVGLFVIDEAHCISKWGIDFRPEYLSLKIIIQRLQNPKVLMLTATASIKVQDDIINKLNLKSVNKIVKSVNRSNIFLGLQKTANDLDKQEYLISAITQMVGPGIIYFSSKRVANLIADMINTSTDLRAAAYHSDLSKEDRFKIQHQFMDDNLQIVCATNAFGMGIDKNNIKFVIHYHMPQDIESYVQEIGRAGRDGSKAIAILMYSPGDEYIAKNLIEQSIPNTEDLFNYQTNQRALIPDNIKELLDYYHQNHYSSNDIVTIFEQELKQKQNELDKLLKYIFCNDCRRKALLKNFDEQYNNHDENCCNQNDEPINLSNFKGNEDFKIKSLKSWQDIMSGLFN